MTLLSIVGDDISRIIPLFYAYKDQIKHHVLLCDDDPSNYERAKTLQQGMQKFSAKHSLGWYTKIITTDEDSAKDIKEAAQKQFDGSDELWLNATDGYPTITILLSEMVRKEGGKILSYDHFDNDLHIIEPDGSMNTNQLATKMDLESYMLLLNYTIVDQKKKEDLTSRKQAITTLYKKESNYQKVREALIYPQASRHDLSLQKDTLNTLEELGIVDSQHKFIGSQRKALEGDLLEEYLFWLCEALHPDDISMSVVVDFDSHQREADESKRIYNEFDILLIHNNRVFTVECKNKKNMEGLEFIYKYDAIIDYFGKTSKAIVVNISNHHKENYIGMKKSKNFAYSTLRRARMSGISVYHESQVNVIKFQNLVQSFFKIGK